MARFAVRRLAWSLPVLFAVHAVTYMATAFLAIRRYGDLEAAATGTTSRLISSINVRTEVALSEIGGAYLSYLQGLGRGELGAWRGGGTVVDAVWHALPKSLLLLGCAVAAAAVIGLIVGCLSVDRSSRRTRPAVFWLNVIGFSAPAFYVAIVAIQGLLLAARETGVRGLVLPAGGFGLDRHLILPVVALALRPTAEIARLTSETLAEQLRLPYVRAAEAKGAGWRRTVWRHALPNVSAPVFVHLGNTVGYLIGSLVVVELLFNWPGVGKLLATAIAPRVDGRLSANVLYDPALVAALVTALAALSLIVLFVTGFLAYASDPRMRRETAS
jgi:peptide/nickel transport system permease protein